MQIQDSVIVVTGANSGLGLALSTVFVQRGAKVIMSGRSEKSLFQEAQRLGATPIVADVTQEDEVHALAEQAVRLHGQIDAWVNNAGVWMPYTNFEDVPVKRAREIIDVNFFGVWHGCQAAYRKMLKQKRGTILNILSIRVKEPVPQTAAYSSSKAAGYGLTQVLRAEAAQHGIRVLAAMPGRMRTNLFEEKMPADHARFMDPLKVSARIADWMSHDHPDPDLVITQEILNGGAE